LISSLQDANIFTPSTPSPLTTSQTEEAEEQETNSDKLPPYKTDLEYLDDHFQVYTHHPVYHPPPPTPLIDCIPQLE